MKKTLTAGLKLLPMGAALALELPYFPLARTGGGGLVFNEQ